MTIQQLNDRVFRAHMRACALEYRQATHPANQVPWLGDFPTRMERAAQCVRFAVAWRKLSEHSIKTTT
jgi:hypothetical protein